MSCLLLNREDYVKCATDVFNILKSKEIARLTADLYKLNERAYNSKYQENNEGLEINYKEYENELKKKYGKEDFYMILRFLNCVAYQCNEDDKESYETALNNIYEITYYIARELFENETTNYRWGYYGTKSN